MSDNIDAVVEAVGRQVAEFAARIEEEDITDTTELNAFAKLCNTYNRLLETAGQSRKVSGADGGIEDEEIDRIFQMTDDDFWRELGVGKFDHLPGNVIHHRCLEMKDPDDHDEKPKLLISV